MWEREKETIQLIVHIKIHDGRKDKMIYVDLVANLSTNDSSPRGWLERAFSRRRVNPWFLASRCATKGENGLRFIPRRCLGRLSISSTTSFALRPAPTSTFIDPLYIYLLYAAVLCATVDARGRKGDLPTYSTGVLSPLAIFDQYYKNQPTDFLREILPPRVPEYFITVHVPATPQRMPRPFFSSPAGTERRKGRKGNATGNWRSRDVFIRAFLLRCFPKFRKIRAKHIQISFFNDFRLFLNLQMHDTKSII